MSQIFGNLSKNAVGKILFGSFEYCMEKTHAYSLNSVHLIWQYLHDSPNSQIKATTKYTMYTCVQLKS